MAEDEGPGGPKRDYAPGLWVDHQIREGKPISILQTFIQKPMILPMATFLLDPGASPGLALTLEWLGIEGLAV